jgi:hypothetical protein
VEAAAPLLQQVCRKLSAAPPQPLAPEELQWLREAMAQPALLVAVTSWAAATFDASRLPASIAAGGSLQSGNAGTLPSVGSLGDSLLRGMAEFLEKRAQKEALRFLRMRLKIELCEQEPADVRRALFSHTCTALDNLDAAASLQSVGSYLRAAVEEDLRQLPDVTLAYASEKKPELAPTAFSARLALAFFAAGRQGRAPLEIVWSLGRLPQRRCEKAGSCRQAARAFRVASAMAYAFRQESESWERSLPKADSSSLPVHVVAVALLAEARLLSLDPQHPRFAPQQLHELAERPGAILDLARTLAVQWKDLQVSLRDEGTSQAEQAALLLGSVRDGAAGLGAMLPAVHALAGEASLDRLEADAARIRLFVDISIDLFERQHGRATVALLQALNNNQVAGQLPEGWGKLLPLLVQLGSAQSANEVAATLDAYAAPLGTYELKYTRPMLALNGFLGAFGGWERTDSNGLGGSAGALAVFAPIGVHATVPIRDSVHVGLLLAALDLGAITTLRGKQGPSGDLAGATDTSAPVEAERAPQVGIQQVFSPGLYATAAPINGYPLVVGFGASMSPKLRRIEQGNVSEDVSVVRYGFFLAVDIPVLPLN